MSEAYILGGVRTPRGKGRDTGALHAIHPQELLAQVLQRLAERTGIPIEEIDDVSIGNVNGTEDHGDCIGRMAVLAAGWPDTVPASTVNRFCGSAQQAITYAAMGVKSGHHHLVVGGGVESMSRTPGRDRPTLDGGNERLRERFPMVPQGISADLIATLEGFSRSDVDQYAAQSQQRAASAAATGAFDASLIAVTDPDGNVVLNHDEHPRPSTTVEGLAKLPAAFDELGTTIQPGFDRTFDAMCLEVYPSLDHVNHVHHAGNSSGVVDGAAAVLVASEDFVRAHGITPRARVVMTAEAGAEPVIMLTAPAAAARRCLERADMTVGDIDLWEINEAFASVPLKVMRDLGLDPHNVNVNGGAIALGHPVGATGAMLIQTALDELERRDLSTALIVMCTGGGMATATIIERV